MKTLRYLLLVFRNSIFNNDIVYKISKHFNKRYYELQTANRKILFKTKNKNYERKKYSYHYHYH